MSLAVADKLLKAFEALKNYREGIPSTDPTVATPLGKKKEVQLTRKDRIVHLNTVCELICTPPIRNLSEFPKLLAIGVDSLLCSCDDAESDVRLVAGESLNKLIKGLLDSNASRLHVELYKEIKKNENPRSLRAALSRFADICHLIRPHKCRPFVANLLPCISRICLSTDDAVQETLAVAMQKIFPILGSFTSDNEVKQLLKTFLPNLRLASATTRRTAASTLAIICHHSRKPSMYREWLLNNLLGMVLPFHEDKEPSVYLGVLQCLRHVIPDLSSTVDDEDDQAVRGSFGSHDALRPERIAAHLVIKNRQLQVYEVIMYCTKHSNHNVVNAALESLHQLLRTPPPDLLALLLSSEGITPTAQEKDSISDSLHDCAFDESETMSVTSSASTTDTGFGSEVGAELDVGQAGADLFSMLDRDKINKEASAADRRLETESDVKDTSSASDRSTSETDSSGAISEKDDDYDRLTEHRRSMSDPLHAHYQGDGSVNNEKENETGIPLDNMPKKYSLGLDESGDRKNSKRSVRELERELNQGEEDNAALRTESISSQDVRAHLERSFQIDAVACKGVPLIHCVRLMCSFLLSGHPGQVLPDSSVRVSVKSLALSCTAQALRLCPEAFFVKVLPDEETGNNAVVTHSQLVRDILLFSSHPDPQLRGCLTLVVGNLIKAALVKARFNFDGWCSRLCEDIEAAPVSLESLVSILSGVLHDESPVAIRQACLALQCCLGPLCASMSYRPSLELLSTLLTLKKSSYWLVKVELLEMIGEIDFRQMTFLETFLQDSQDPGWHSMSYLHIQSWLIKDTALQLLGDEDGRVRHAAALCVQRIVPNLLCSADLSRQQVVLASVNSATVELSVNTSSSGQVAPKPHSQLLHHMLSTNLSTVITEVTSTFSHATTKSFLLGCTHALCLLSQAYPPSQFPAAWGCGVVKNCKTPLSPLGSERREVTPRPSSPSLCCTGGGGPLALAVGYLTTSLLAYDLDAHQDILKLTGDLLFGVGSCGAHVVLRDHSTHLDDSTRSPAESWNLFSDSTLAPLAEKVISHIVRLLNIFTHVMDNTIPGVHSFKISFPGQNKERTSVPVPTPAAVPVPGIAAPQTPGAAHALSTVPKRLLTKSKRALSEADIATVSSDKSGSPTKTQSGGNQATEQEQTPTPPTKSNLGTFHNLPHYMKLYDVIKGTYSNYRVTLGSHSRDKFAGFLRVTLETLSALLEVITFQDIGKHVEEILGYLQMIAKHEPTKTFLCVQQLLRTMFGINAASQPEVIQTPVVPPSLRDSQVNVPGSIGIEMQSSDVGLFDSCFTEPQRRFSQDLTRAAHKSEDGSKSKGFSGFLKKVRLRAASVVKPAVKLDKQSPIHSFIRLFEPLVIRALKEYTISSSAALQQQVLSLLAQLVRLRVNYSLLDADQVFISFVQRQFEFIDAGQVQDCKTFLPHVFQFLVLLSYECFQQKSNQAKAIVGMPKIIQMCDGIMASGQAPVSHAIPALQPIVHDLFDVRGPGKSDAAKELETQREVVVSMLLRLVQYPQVLEMLVTVLHCYRRDAEDKWKKMSRQVIDFLLPLLVKQEVVLDTVEDYGMLVLLYDAVAPVSFRPADVLLKVLFAPVDLSRQHALKRWLSMLLVTIRVVMAQCSEEVLLSRMSQMDLGVDLLAAITDGTDNMRPVHPLKGDISVDQLLVMLLFHAVRITTHRVALLTARPGREPFAQQDGFLIKQLASLLLSMAHLFRCGFFKKITHAAHCLANTEVAPLSIELTNSEMRLLTKTCPLVVLYWCDLLRLLQYSEASFWFGLIDSCHSPNRSAVTTSDNNGSSTQDQRVCHTSLSREVVKQGVLLAFSGHLVEQAKSTAFDLSKAAAILSKYLPDIVHLYNEPPVQEMFGILKSTPDGSQMLLETIRAENQELKEFLNRPRFGKRLLQCIVGVHSSQTSLLVCVLSDTFLESRFRAVTRMAESNICSLLEGGLATSNQKRWMHVSNDTHVLQPKILNKLSAPDTCSDSHVLSVNAMFVLHQRTCLEELALVCGQLVTKPSARRNPRLFSLVRRLLATTNHPDTEVSFSVEVSASLRANKYTVDREWLPLLAHHCCGVSSSSVSHKRKTAQEAVQLLSVLNYSTVYDIMQEKTFDTSLLEECITCGVERTLLYTARRLDSEENEPTSPYDNTEHFDNDGIDHVLQAAQATLVGHVERNTEELFESYVAPGSGNGAQSPAIRLRVRKVIFLAKCKDATWCSHVTSLARALIIYTSSLNSLPAQCQISQLKQVYICRFVFLPLMVIIHKLRSGHIPGSEEMRISLDCLGKILHRDYEAIASGAEYVPLVCSTISHLYALVKAAILRPGEMFSSSVSDEHTNEEEHEFESFHAVTRACDQISELVHCIHVHLLPQVSRKPTVPQHLIGPFHTAIVGLARLPLVNTFARTPPLVWKLGWMPTPEGPLQTELPPVPIEILKEKDVLNEFVLRVNILGWTSRQQFEETWAALLGVLSSPPLPENVSTEEDMESSNACCLAVRSITALLLQTAWYPVPGNPAIGGHLHGPRHRHLPFLGSRAGRKLAIVRGIIEEEFVSMCCSGGREYLSQDKMKQERSTSIRRSNSFGANHSNGVLWISHRLLFDHPLYSLNIDRIPGYHDFTLGQISINGLQSQSLAEVQEDLDSEDDAAVVVSLPRMPGPGKPDIKSCLQFLLELFNQWMSPYVHPRPPLMLVAEAAKALTVLSDLFVGSSHLEWVLDTCLELYYNHPQEDELVTQYLLPSICKALAFLKLEGPTAEKVCKIIEASLRSNHVPLQVSALYSTMYIIESHVPSVVAIVIPLLLEYMNKKLIPLTDVVALPQQQLLVMWSTAFYLLEHCGDEITDIDFKANVLKTAVRVASSNEESAPPAIYHAIMRGLERLVVSFALSTAQSDSLVKLSVDRLTMQNPQRVISALGLLITCMYTGKIGDRAGGLYPKSDVSDFPPEDRLLVAMERVTVLFDRIRKGFPSEARVVSRVLPRLLLDFFPPQEIMNKVIGEFLSSQQPHPDLMATVLFKVFEGLQIQGQHTDVRDWVMLSLGSFIQRTPLAMALWSLTCFFVSASTSKWLRALFPHVVGRMGKMEDMDIKYFCAAALDFYKNQSLDQLQKEAFISIFKSVEHTSGPYKELLSCCRTCGI